MAFEETDELLRRWRCMLAADHRAVEHLSASNSVVSVCAVVVRSGCRLDPFFISIPVWVRSIALDLALP